MKTFEGVRKLIIVERVRVEAESAVEAMFKFIDDEDGVRLVHENEGDYECDYNDIVECSTVTAKP